MFEINVHRLFKRNPTIIYNYFYFEMKIIAALVASAMALDTGFGPSFSIAKDTNNANNIKITASVPANTYLVLAFGEAHDAAVDMLYFGGKASANYKDMHGKEGTVPTEDAADKRNLQCTVTGSGPYSFDCTRALNTGDTTSPDTVLACGKSYDFEYMGSDATAELQATPPKHGGVKLTLDASCVATLEKVAEKAAGAMAKTIAGATVLAASYMLF